MSNLTRNTITSMEVAEMVGKEHSKLLRDIRNYVSQLAEAKIGLGDFFTEATYKDANNQNRPCFQVTKKGCEFIAHKLTGQKGTEFTARYINRFHEMEDGKLPCPLNPIIASSVAEGTLSGTFIHWTYCRPERKVCQRTGLLSGCAKRSCVRIRAYISAAGDPGKEWRKSEEA